MLRRLQMVDVFTATPYRGNPVAVVLDSDGLDTEAMQRFAHWMNLSETTFLAPPTDPDADYAVRIFTPSEELPFAGHPTLGTCHAWLAAGGTSSEGAAEDVVRQECGAGIIQIRLDAGRLSLAAPPLVRSGDVEVALVERVAAILNIQRSDIQDAQWVDNGPGWVAVMLADPDAVLSLEPGPVGDMKIGVVAPYPEGSPHAFEVRAFFSTGGSTVEDPVTGSLNASLAQWLLGSGAATAPYVASQGAALGRAGRVYISQDDDGTIWVGGGTVICITGEVDL